MNQSILERLKAYKSMRINNRLSEEEKTTLMTLFLKAISPPVESILSNPNNEEEFDPIDAFDNCSDQIMSEASDELAKIFTEVSIAIGTELGKYLYKHNHKEPNDEIIDGFTEEMGFPPKVFNKGIVLSHMYCMELLHQGYNPVPAILNVDNILKSAEKSLRAIMVTAKVTKRTLEENESKK
jgi:hypothetical protein